MNRSAATTGVKNRRLRECLDGTNSHEYILPFLWMHGESHELLREEIDAIYNTGVMEFCMESRPYEGFGGEQWWCDVGFILAYAREKGMRVWLLEDRAYPTIVANGYLASHPELKRKGLRLECRDAAGPLKDAVMMAPAIAAGEEFFAVTAFRRTKNGDVFEGEGIDLLGKLKDGRLVFDVPEGIWRVFYVIRTTNMPGNPLWIDMMSRESCEAMIHAVHRPHFEHFGEYFGNTFAGFFSDEPCFGNRVGDPEAYLGRSGTILPYRDDIVELLAEEAGLAPDKVRMLLPALYQTYEGPEYRSLRNAFMQVATKQFEKNFSTLLGEWCRSHGVMHIGHIIEDANLHQRLGNGAGHYFRSIGHMDMAGIDTVLHQYLPGMPEIDHTAVVGPNNRVSAEFNNHLLTRLPSSLAHVSPLTKGRTMCEIFGAYGWGEGVPMMKKMADYMLVGGINHFVPHAFSPRFPDPDCPPHFYGNGKNAQYRAFGQLMRYMDRASHVLSGGSYAAKIAVLYNAEAEWCGDKNEQLQGLCRRLDEWHIAFDILWEDVLRNAPVKDGKIVLETVNADGPDTRAYSALVLPYCSYLPENMIEDVSALKRQGVAVYVLGSIPPRSTVSHLPADFECLPENELRRVLWDAAGEEGRLEISGGFPLLKYYRTLGKGGDGLGNGCGEGDGHRKGASCGDEVIFLYSEDNFREMRFTLTMNSSRPVRIYDMWNNELLEPRQNGRLVEVCLEPSGSVMIVADDTPCKPFDYSDKPRRKLTLENVSTTLESSDGTISETAPFGPGVDVTQQEGYKNFHGTITYRGEIVLREGESAIRLDRAGEIVTLTVDGECLGTMLSTNCFFRLPDSLRGPARRRVEIAVVNSPAYWLSDQFTTWLTVPGSGLLGDVTAE